MMGITGMITYKKQIRIMAAHAVLVSLVLSLASCNGPKRLTEADISLERASEVVQKRMIAPKTEEERREYALPELQPRRTLLQVLHNPSSLSNPDFVNLLQQQISEEISFRAAQRDRANKNSADNATPLKISPKLTPPERAAKLSDAAQGALIKTRMNERRRLMYDRGAALEDALYKRLGVLQATEEALAREVIPGLSKTIPNISGKNLTRDPNGYLSMPANMVFIGGRASNMPSKTALLHDYVDDKMITLAVREMPLANLLLLITNALDMQVSLSNQILASDVKVTLHLHASALSILDAVLSQHSLVISFDPDVEIARFYDDAELEAQLQDIRAVIVAYNQLHFARKKLQLVRNDVGALKSMLVLVQRLMRGDSEGFLAGTEAFVPAALGAEAITALRELSNAGFSLRPWLEQFDSETQTLLHPEDIDPSGANMLASVLSRFDDILVEDPCIIPGQEVFVEKIAVYNKESTQTLKYLETYFNKFQTQTTTETTAGQAPDEAAVPLAQPVAQPQQQSPNLPDGCTTSPSLRSVSLQADATGIIIQGTRVQNSIAMRLVAEDDSPQMQVLVEIFMVTVERDFSRQLENLIKATDTAGKSGVIEANLLTSISSAITGGYAVNLSAPTGQITSALKFLEKNQLGRIISSPTLLVRGDGGEATISREQVAEVLYRSLTYNKDNTTTINDRNTALEAPLTLSLKNVRVLPATNNVKMDVTIENKRFIRAVSTIVRQEDADYTRDVISTSFTAAPGDVIVLAGLTANSDKTNTSGLPGTTTGVLAPVAGLLGGQDSVSNQINEMVIFLVPTVFDPSSDKQPHAPFK